MPKIDKLPAAQQAKHIPQRMEVQLKQLMVQLDRVKELKVPDFGSLQAWEARASASSGLAANDPTYV